MANEFVKTVKEAVYKIQLLLLDGICHEKQLFSTRALLSRVDYEDVVTERAISNICGYPLCRNPLPSYQSNKGRYRISLKEHTVYDLHETRNFCSSKCVISSRAFSASLKSERHSIFEFTNVEEVLRLFGDLSVGDQEKIVEMKEKSGHSKLKIVEKKDVKDGEVSLEQWIGPANAIEGYVPVRDRCPSLSREKGITPKGPGPEIEKEFFGDYSDFTSEIIVGDQLATPKTPPVLKKNIEFGSNVVTIDQESSSLKQSSRKKKSSDRKVKKSAKEITIREEAELTKSNLDKSSSVEAKALDGSTEKVELDVSSTIETKAVDGSSGKVVKLHERLPESSMGFITTGETTNKLQPESSIKFLETKTSVEATESFAHADNDHLVSTSNSSGSVELKDLSESKGEVNGKQLKSSLKSSRERALNRSVTWADEKKSGNIDDSNLCKFEEIENRCGGKGSLEAFVRENETISFRVTSAEACAQALTQAAEVVVSGEFDSGDAVSEAGICILPQDAEGNEDMYKPHQYGSEWPWKPVFLVTDASWHDSPPEGISFTLSPFLNVWMALFGWISSSSLAYIYGRDGCEEDAFSSVNGIEYPRKTFLSAGRSSEIKQTLAVCIAQALPELAIIFRISTPISTLEKFILAFSETMSFLEALPPFKRAQWHVIVLLFLEALSVSRIPSLTQNLANTREVQQKVLNDAQVSTEEYKMLKDHLMPLRQAPEFSVQNGG